LLPLRGRQKSVILAVGEGPAESPTVRREMSLAPAQPDAPEHRTGQESAAGFLPDTRAQRLIRALPFFRRAAGPVGEVVQIATTVVAAIGEPAAPVALEVGEVGCGRRPRGQK